MQRSTQRRQFKGSIPWYVGIAGLIAGGVWSLQTMVLGFVHSADNNNDEKNLTERTRIEACNTIEEEATRAFCINGEDD